MSVGCVDVRAIPAELRALPRWLRWKAVSRPDDPKPRKLPVRPSAPGCAKSTDPTTWGTLEEALANVGRHGTCGLGLAIAPPYFGIDVDDCLTEEGTPNAKAADLLARFQTYAEISPSGYGLHLIGRGTLNGHGGITKEKGRGIEVYDAKRYFTFSGNLLPGAPPTVNDCQAALDVLVAELDPPKPKAPPAPARKKAKPDVFERARAYVAKMPEAISGQGGSIATLRVAARLLKGFALPDEEAWDLLCEYNGRCVPPWSEKDLRHKFEDAKNGPLPEGFMLEDDREDVSASSPPPVARPRLALVPTPRTPEPQPKRIPRPWTDSGNAERLVDRFGDRIRWCKALGWLAWDGARWARDDRNVLPGLAKETARAIYAEAADEPNDEKRAALAKWARLTESRAARAAMVALAESERPVVVHVSELDTDPFLLNVMNGIIDLRTGEFLPHDRSRLITKLSPVRFDPKASAPRWMRFLEEILPDPEVRAFVQRLLGYALTATVRDDVFPVLFGPGANGKTRFLETIGYVWGDHFVKASPDLLLAKKQPTHPTERMTLFGRRLAACAESGQGRTLDEALVKSLTGGDTINARHMHHDEINFEPTHKLLLLTNHRPRVRDSSEGMWRRLLLVPFTVVIPEEKRDTALKEKLRAEAPGVLRWAVEGCLAWQRTGLRPPDAVRIATEEYRRAEDFLAEFIADRCYVVPESDRSRRRLATVQAGELYREFREWAEENRMPVVSIRRFGEAIAEHEIEKDFSATHQSVYVGIRLLTEGERAVRQSTGGGS